MIFKRKLYSEMLQWKQDNEGASALLIKGARRVGKSTLAKEFAKNEYGSFIAIDFAKCSKEVKDLFDDISDLDYIFIRLQMLYKVTLKPRKSVIIFDEVQKCPNARQAIKYLIEDADLAILNQETIISKSNEVRGANGGALLFNSPPEVADAVIDLGFDVFTMANNHLLDFGASGLEESINFWNEKASENDLTVLGAYLNEEDSNNIRVREVNGVKIAFLAYAEHINGFSIPYDSPLRVVMNYETDVIERQIKEAKEIADAVIVSAHWGVEDTNIVSEDRIELANQMVNWGADVILGCHTHTAETMEWIEREDGTKGFVFYSMGNFICCQTDNFNLVGEMPDFDLVVDGATGELRLEDVGVIPNIIHYEAGDFTNLAVYPYSKYTPDMAAVHGIPYAVPAGTYNYFSYDILNEIIDAAIPKEFQKLDK